jgi:hypothetical protein
MSSFDDREKGFEAKYKVDQETQFKIIVRRNKLLGEWAAGQMGLSGDDAATYAKDVVTADFDRPGDSDVIEKVLADLSAKGVKLSETDIKKKIEELQSVARTEIVGAQK